MPENAFRPDQRRARVPSRRASLDLVRGLSIQGVIVFHTGAVFPTGIRTLDWALATGRFGVKLFFFGKRMLGATCDRKGREKQHPSQLLATPLL